MWRTNNDSLSESELCHGSQLIALVRTSVLSIVPLADGIPNTSYTSWRT